LNRWWFRSLKLRQLKGVGFMKNMLKKVMIVTMLIAGFGTTTMVGTSEKVEAASWVRVLPGNYYATNTSKLLKARISKVQPNFVTIVVTQKNGDTLYMSVVRNTGRTYAQNLKTKRYINGIRTYFPNRGQIQIKFPSSSYTGTSTTYYKINSTL